MRFFQAIVSSAPSRQKRAFDSFAGSFSGLDKRAFDALAGSGFDGFNKRAFDSFAGQGFGGFDKRAFDSLSGSGLTPFNKRAFDALSGSGFGGFDKRSKLVLAGPDVLYKLPRVSNFTSFFSLYFSPASFQQACFPILPKCILERLKQKAGLDWVKKIIKKAIVALSEISLISQLKKRLHCDVAELQISDSIARLVSEFLLHSDGGIG
ncbi:unnamed protein product [Cylicostephanus goldi]|uniref:Uncharacterized protein n=1 Tax=Cylicostephanus goldi TaxID=71465 RepID=A0A3P6RTS6_CYLGO|nr:unnamed protein product [Cylicostephanus goldi]